MWNLDIKRNSHNSEMPQSQIAFALNKYGILYTLVQQVSPGHYVIAKG